MFCVNWGKLHSFLFKKLIALKKKVSKNHKQIKKVKNAKREFCSSLQKWTWDEMPTLRLITERRSGSLVGDMGIRKQMSF